MYLGTSLALKKDQLRIWRLRAKPIQNRVKYTHLETQAGSPIQGTHRSLRALAFSSRLTTPKPPCAKGSWHVSRLTCSVLQFHRKAKIALVMRVWTQPGMGITVAKYQRPDAPIVLMIVDLPLRESVRDFQRLSFFSSLETRLVQLS